MLSEIEIAHFRTFGFVVLRQCFDPGPLSAELDEALRNGQRVSFRADLGKGGIEGRYLPMMTAETPVSLALLDAFAEPAAQLLGWARPAHASQGSALRRGHPVAHR